MAHLTRRQLISGLAATTAAFSIGCSKHIKSHEAHPADAKLAAAKPCDNTLAGPNNPGLNVFLHGLFLVSTQNGLINLYTPEVIGPPAHVFKAGKWLNEQTLNKSSKISLAGINAGSKPSFLPTEHFIVPQGGPNDPTFNGSSSYFSSFQLPFPANPPKFRRKLLKPTNFEFFMHNDGQHDDLGMEPKSVPLVYVFTYPASQFTGQASDVKLLMDSTRAWSFAPDATNFISYDLHIHAEPEQCPDPNPDPDPNHNHIDDAYNAVNNMFTPHLTLKLNVPEQKTNGDCDEDASFIERNCPHSKGGETANCTSLILGG
jgi:hypothetical protein